MIYECNTIFNTNLPYKAGEDPGYLTMFCFSPPSFSINVFDFNYPSIESCLTEKKPQKFLKAFLKEEFQVLFVFFKCLI